MEYSAILHRPMSEYAFATDESHYVFRLRSKREDLIDCRFWYADRASMEKELSFESAPMRLIRRDKYYDYFEAALETAFLRIAYYFEVYDGKDRMYYLGDCFETSPDVGRAEHFQLPFNLRADRVEVPAWVKDAVVYNIFPDSFASGRRVISDVSGSEEHNCKECLSLHGGTIRGIEENLDYIKGLGCNCIYLNPIFAADSYHKYDITDYFHIDPTRGSDEDFGRLVESAHSMGLRV